MMVMRPIRREDQYAFGEFSFQLAMGMTNLPKDESGLKEKITLSESSFQKEFTQPGNELYFFVMEDLTNGKIAATSAILAEASSTRAHYYRVKTIKTQAKHPLVKPYMNVLEVVRENEKASEVCSLYLHPNYRHLGLGRLISLSRFLFIAQERPRFESLMMAEMRGYIDENYNSPFWDAVGRHFCNLSYPEFLHQSENNKSLVQEILPEFPIYIDLLPRAAQEAINKIHPHTGPALEMLMEQGFSYEEEVDVCDGGPVVMVKTDEIRSVKKNEWMKAVISDHGAEGDKAHIISNNRLDFRACYGSVLVDKHHGLIRKEVAEALEVKEGDYIRFITTH